MTRAQPQRGIFCNRTLNLRAIRAIGYDMDYTLVHYRVQAWETRAYEYLRQKLIGHGWPLSGLEFDHASVIRGLVLDLELGNIVKVNRFGYVKLACHGTQLLSYEQQRSSYAGVVVDLSASDRFAYINTLFSLSEVCMYAQLVDLLDADELPGVLGYGDLYRAVREALDETHMEGQLKAEIVADPDRFVELDPETPLALLDQKYAGKSLLLITNSEWKYTQAMMAYCFDRFLPKSMSWRDLFDVSIVGARKPVFFDGQNPFFEVVDPDNGLLQPSTGRIQAGKVYWGGNASEVEEWLGVSGDQILYVGDHIYGDVRMSKKLLKWRTALVLRELEEDILATEGFREHQRRLSDLMEQKQRLEAEFSQVRLRSQRKEKGYAEQTSESPDVLRGELQRLRQQLAELDTTISPLARAAAEQSNPRWGLLTRTGNDKSMLARQVERHADIYLSRVSNFLYVTPFVYLRSPRGSLPHDDLPGVEPLE